MKKPENTALKRAGTSGEDNTYVNLKDLQDTKIKNYPNRRETPAAAPAKNAHHQVLLILVVLLIVMFLVLVVLVSLQFMNYSKMAEEVSQIKNNDTQLLKSDMNELRARDAENDKMMKSKLKELESRVNELTAELQRNVENLNKINKLTAELQKNVENLNKRPSCESGWVEFEGHCYLFTNFELNWTRAEMMCLNRGSHLVIVNNQAEQNFIESRRSNGKPYWIGLTDLETEGTFKWVDGTGSSYTSWRRGEPNDEKRTEDCVEIAREGSWNDMPCDRNLTAICEKRMM